MEMHQLQYFVRVAEAGNFTRAAEACFVSQPSLSQAVLKLEKELGQPLFQRLGRRVRLTDAGRILLDRAQQILALVEDARARIGDSSDAGRIVLAAIPTIAPYFLPQLLKQFVQHHSGASIDVHEEVTQSAIKRLLSGELDVAILALPIDEIQLQVEKLCDEELWLVLPSGHPLAEKKRVTVRDVEDEPFVLLNEAHCLSDQVLSFCRRRSFQPVATGRTNQLATVQELVSLGQGISMVPEMARRLDRSKSRVYRSFAGEKPKRTLALAWHKQRFQSRLVKDFCQAAHSHAVQLLRRPG